MKDLVSNITQKSGIHIKDIENQKRYIEKCMNDIRKYENELKKYYDILDDIKKCHQEYKNLTGYNAEFEKDMRRATQNVEMMFLNSELSSKEFLELNPTQYESYGNVFKKVLDPKTE